MNIGVDVDGVLADAIEKLLIFLESEKGLKLKREDFTTFDWKNTIDPSKEKALDIIYDFLYSNHFDEIGVIDGAKKGLVELKKSNDLFVLTARQHFLKDRTHNWLNRNFPGMFKDIFVLDNNYDHRTAPPTEKGDICLKHNISILIEDDVDHAQYASKKGIKVLLLDQPWNRLFKESGNITRVKDWKEIITIINNEQDANSS